MIDKNQSLTERVFDYNAEIRKNPFSILIPLKGDRIIHALFQEIRHDTTKTNSSLRRNLTYLVEGCFYTEKYVAYLGLAIKTLEIIQ